MEKFQVWGSFENFLGSCQSIFEIFYLTRYISIPNRSSFEYLLEYRRTCLSGSKICIPPLRRNKSRRTSNFVKNFISGKLRRTSSKISNLKTCNFFLYYFKNLYLYSKAQSNLKNFSLEFKLLKESTNLFRKPWNLQNSISTSSSKSHKIWIFFSQFQHLRKEKIFSFSKTFEYCFRRVFFLQ